MVILWSITLSFILLTANIKLGNQARLASRKTHIYMRHVFSRTLPSIETVTMTVNSFSHIDKGSGSRLAPKGLVTTVDTHTIYHLSVTALPSIFLIKQVVLVMKNSRNKIQCCFISLARFSSIVKDKKSQLQILKSVLFQCK